MAILIGEELLGDLEDWQRAFLDNFILGIGSIATIAVIIFLVRAHFARRLKGFGLNIKTIVKDFFVAFINLLTVWPLVIAAITTIFGFGMLVLVPMPIEQQFGIITALTIFYALLTSLFILPPVLMYWGKWKKKKHGYIISPGKPKKIDEE